VTIRAVDVCPDFDFSCATARAAGNRASIFSQSAARELGALKRLKKFSSKWLEKG
jgi:hypothetical protein